MESITSENQIQKRCMLALRQREFSCDDYLRILRVELPAGKRKMEKSQIGILKMKQAG